MVGSHRATSADSSPGSGGHRGGRALGREGRRWRLSPDVLLTDTPPPSFLSRTQAWAHTLSHPNIQDLVCSFTSHSPTLSPSWVSRLLIHSLSHPFIPAFTSSLPHLLVFHSCTYLFNKSSEPCVPGPFPHSYKTQIRVW